MYRFKCKLIAGFLLTMPALVNGQDLGDSERDRDFRYYLGATVGQARGQVGDREMNQRMAELGYSAQARVDGQNRRAWGALAGFNWTRHIGLEAGYTDLGEVRTRLSGVTSDIEAYLARATEVHPRTISGYELAVLARWPLLRDLDIYARGGLLVGDSKYRANAVSDSASRIKEESDFTYGLGFDYDFSERWALRGGWNRYEVEGEDIDFFGASILYRFSQVGKQRTEVAPSAPLPVELRDRDGDGVNDALDQCPATPAGLQVNSEGCPLDSDMGGVADDRDQCPETGVSVDVDAQGCEAGPPAVPEGVAESIELKILFDTDSAEVKPAFYAEIQQVADYLKRNADAKVTIEGHTDIRGGADYNVRLSQRRADAVQQVLIQRMDVAPERVKAIGFGDQRLLRLDHSKEAHDANRRVVATIESAQDQEQAE